MEKMRVSGCLQIHQAVRTMYIFYVVCSQFDNQGTGPDRIINSGLWKAKI